MSADTSSALGGERIILLCDKVRREDISIVFFEQDANRSVIWKKEINYKSSKDFRVHHQTAISFLTPAYRDYDIGETRKTFVQLHRPSDREFSEPSSFEFIPNAQSTYLGETKRFSCEINAAENVPIVSVINSFFI